MSEPLTPEQQREMRVRMGGEVQGLHESISGSDAVDPSPPIADLRRRLAMIEACRWLREGAPGVALEVLEKALKI
jgi:hypothetical protein